MLAWCACFKCRSIVELLEQEEGRNEKSATKTYIPRKAVNSETQHTLMHQDNQKFYGSLEPKDEKK